MIDWTKEIERADNGIPVRLGATFRIDNSTRHIVIDDGEFYWICDDQGYVCETCGLDAAVNVRNRPAPAACEHETDGLKLTSDPPQYWCKKCQRFYLPETSPTPAPDSVEIARKLIETLGEAQFLESNNRKRELLRDLQNYVTAVAAEQTAQRRAAGELAAKLSKFDGTGFSIIIDNAIYALAADAAARGGAK